MPLSPLEFVDRWRGTDLNELAAYQVFFNGLCDLVQHPKPGDAGTDDASYRFEYPVRKPGGQFGRADVFKKGAWVWEFKDLRTRKLEGAYEQLLTYRDSLENPPLLIVCNLEKFLIRTAFSNTPSKAFEFTLEDLLEPSTFELLRNAFHDPERLNPKAIRERVTAAAAVTIGELARSLEARGVPSASASHFLMQMVFALFAEDARLLPAKLVTRILERTSDNPERARQYLGDLFHAMAHGGEVLLEDVPHFNGGLFTADTPIPPLEVSDLKTLRAAAQLAWEEVEPSIFGTLFERALDPKKRAQLGAHYTSRDDINRLTEPVILEPLRREWQIIRDRADAALLAGATGKIRVREVDEPVTAFITRLHTLRVLDPACGSGNFLYVAMQSLKTLERDVIAYSQSIGVGGFLTLGPRQFYGLEINPLAHELASVVVWIGYLQWMSANGYSNYGSPILERLDNIRNVDALLELLPDGTMRERAWPEAEFIVGNPPFLGNYRMRSELGDGYTETLRKVFDNRVPGFADFVCYWFEKARASIETGTTKRAGLIATNSIRGGANRKVLERIAVSGGIFNAWSDRDWILDGAAVRVSMVCFDGGAEKTRWLDDKIVATINPDLSSNADISAAKRLPENAGKSFEGVKPAGPFDLPDAQARAWLNLPNPSGVSNRDVLRRYINGRDITDKSSNRWIVDFNQMPLEAAREFVLPFRYVEENVKPIRDTNNRKAYRERWWWASEARPGMRKALEPLTRYMATSQVAKHRFFVWLEKIHLPASLLTVIAADDDFTFGIVNARVHTTWALKMGTALEDRPRYTPTTCFETYPFPHATPDARAAVAKAGAYLHTIREHLKTSLSKTLTELYNDLQDCRVNPKPTHAVYSLYDAHERLDAAVIAAYGWNAPLGDDEILAKLLALNLERAVKSNPING